jgi:hypothetical protein
LFRIADLNEEGSVLYSGRIHVHIAVVLLQFVSPGSLCDGDCLDAIRIRQRQPATGGD